MAARLRLHHQDEVRAKIQSSQLINRLTNHAFGEVELTATQIKAIEILLRKSVPDLQAIQLSGDSEHPVELRFKWTDTRPTTTAACPTSSRASTAAEPEGFAVDSSA